MSRRTEAWYVETPRTITDWSDATFGPSKTNLAVAGRAIREADELLALVDRRSGDETQELADKVAFECADILIVICRIPEKIKPGYDLFGDLKCHTAPCVISPVARYTYERAYRIRAQLVFLMNELESTDESEASVMRVQKITNSLSEITNAFGRDLRAYVDAKMVINRGRTWTKPDSNLDSQHIEPEDFVHRDTDENGCITAPDGTCVSEGPCIHSTPRRARLDDEEIGLSNLMVPGSLAHGPGKD